MQLPEDFALETEALKKAVTEKTRIIFICNPHSPSGTLYKRETILNIIDFCKKKDIIVSVDENYIEFAHNGEAATMASYVKQCDNLFVIRSVTNTFRLWHRG